MVGIIKADAEDLAIFLDLQERRHRQSAMRTQLRARSLTGQSTRPRIWGLQVQILPSAVRRVFRGHSRLQAVLDRVLANINACRHVASFCMCRRDYGQGGCCSEVRSAVVSGAHALRGRPLPVGSSGRAVMPCDRPALLGVSAPRCGLRPGLFPQQRDSDLLPRGCAAPRATTR